MEYRKLNKTEITTLTAQGCHAENWDSVLVKPEFDPQRVRHVSFSGEVRLGYFRKIVDIDDGIAREAGLFNCYLRNCTIGDDVYISDVKNLVNYTIEEGVVIENVGSLTVNGETCFGNGTEIEVLNEAGGRELPIFDQLSSQIAYLLVNYRHDALFQEKLKKLIANYSATKKSRQGLIQKSARIRNSQVLRNVSVGQFCRISGAVLLEEGTIVSEQAAPVFIGEGVIAKNFIILAGSRVDGAAMLANSFIGQAVKIGKQYSMENSAFFANSEGFHGEACCVFAGPYTITHHKSTLLIAGLFSFYNAGSGTNQSNHAYKLGPVHQGILERGCKTGSFSYLLWPSRVGAFTAVIGKHYVNFDASDLPFSYIDEEDGKSVLTPAMNLLTVGTRRDSSKWSARDQRKSAQKLDLIHFELFNPYTIGKVIRGIRLLTSLYENTAKEVEFVTCKGIQIKRLLLKSCRKYYEMALKIFIGNELIKRLGDFSETTSFADLKQQLMPSHPPTNQNWVDLAGMFAPINRIDELIASIKNDRITTIEALLEALKKIHADYAENAWTWCVHLISEQLQIEFKDWTPAHLIQIVKDWKIYFTKFNNMILNDAQREFYPTRQIGFGIDGDEAIRMADFTAVRGTYADNSFVKELNQASAAIALKADNWIAVLEKFI